MMATAAATEPPKREENVELGTEQHVCETTLICDTSKSKENVIFVEWLSTRHRKDFTLYLLTADKTDVLLCTSE